MLVLVLVRVRVMVLVLVLELVLAFPPRMSTTLSPRSEESSPPREESLPSSDSSSGATTTSSSLVRLRFMAIVSDASYMRKPEAYVLYNGHRRGPGAGAVSPTTPDGSATLLHFTAANYYHNSRQVGQ